MQQFGSAVKSASDYVTPTFQRIFGRTEKARGAGPTLGPAGYPNLQTQIEIRESAESKTACFEAPS